MVFQHNCYSPSAQNRWKFRLENLQKMLRIYLHFDNYHLLSYRICVYGNWKLKLKCSNHHSVPKTRFPHRNLGIVYFARQICCNSQSISDCIQNHFWCTIWPHIFSFVQRYYWGHWHFRIQSKSIHLHTVKDLLEMYQLVILRFYGTW